MDSPESRTDRDYWNDVWAQPTKARILHKRNPVLGQNGWFLRAMPSLHGKRIVELGGGGSYFLLAFAKWQGAHASAIDYSSAGISQTNAIFAANQQSVETACADIFTWTPASRYDAVLHFGLVEHFSDPLPLLRKCEELVVDGGQVIFTVPNMEAWGAALWRKYSPSNWSRHVLHSDQELRDVCAAAGLQLDRVFFFGWPLLQIAPWESPAGWLKAVSLAQRLTNLANPLFSSGFRTLSCYRGVVASRPAR